MYDDEFNEYSINETPVPYGPKAKLKREREREKKEKEKKSRRGENTTTGTFLFHLISFSVCGFQRESCVYFPIPLHILQLHFIDNYSVFLYYKSK